MATLATLTQRERFMRLYRNALKVQWNWTNNRELWLNEAWKLHKRFEANMKVDAKRGLLLLEKGEKELYEWRHPDPYVFPTSPGGSKWQRNVPPPPHICDPHAQHYHPSETDTWKEKEH